MNTLLLSTCVTCTICIGRIVAKEVGVCRASRSAAAARRPLFGGSVSPATFVGDDELFPAADWNCKCPAEDCRPAVCSSVPLRLCVECAVRLRLRLGLRVRTGSAVRPACRTSGPLQPRAQSPSPSASELYLCRSLRPPRAWWLMAGG